MEVFDAGAMSLLPPEKPDNWPSTTDQKSTDANTLRLSAPRNSGGLAAHLFSFLPVLVTSWCDHKNSEVKSLKTTLVDDPSVFQCTVAL